VLGMPLRKLSALDSGCALRTLLPEQLTSPQDREIVEAFDPAGSGIVITAHLTALLEGPKL
jgi:hypothetical protein